VAGVFGYKLFYTRLETETRGPKKNARADDAPGRFGQKDGELDSPLQRRLVDVVPHGALKTGKSLKARSEENYANDGMGRLPAKFQPKIQQGNCRSRNHRKAAKH